MIQDTEADLRDRLHDLEARYQKLAEAAEMLWIVVANASGGDWSKQTEEWQKAAARSWDNYFAVLNLERAVRAESDNTLYEIFKREEAQ